MFVCQSYYAQINTLNDHLLSAVTKELPALEECPKWAILKDVLAEIEENNKSADTELGTGCVLIAAQDDRTCSQIKEVSYFTQSSLVHWKPKRSTDCIKHREGTKWK